MANDSTTASSEPRTHRNLDVYWKAHDLVQMVYDLSDGFPRWEALGLRSQLTRAAQSVPANIAEGAARSTSRDFAHFLSNSRASLSEIDSHMEIATRRGYVTRETADSVYDAAVVVGKMLTQLRRAILRRSAAALRPS